MGKIPHYYYSIFVGLLLSDGWSNIPTHHDNKININARIKLRQPYANLEYIWAVFNIIRQYCDRYPYHYVGLRNGKSVHDVIIRTQCLPCFIELHYMFYFGSRPAEKFVPQNIYDILTPIALAHWILGSGTKLHGRGLRLCIGSFNNHNLAGVMLINVLIIKYRLECSIQLGIKKPWIYIYRSSMGTLETIVKPYMISKLLHQFFFNFSPVVGSARIQSRGRLFSTRLTSHKNITRHFNTSANVNDKLNPWFLSGFSDAKASFMLFFNKNDKCKTGYGAQACFQIGLHEKDRALLEMIRASLRGVGNITKQGKDSIQYRVTSSKDLAVIVDHFDKYPLITHKWIDYVLFKQGFELILAKKHLTKEGIKKNSSN